MRIDELSTPAPLIEMEVLSRNLQRAVENNQSRHVKYRPHVKTHKMTAVARMQVRAGAQGITCAKVGEAEVMARAGLEDIFIAYSVVGRSRLERLAALDGKCRISIGVDSREAAQAVSEYYSSKNKSLDVVMEIDTGHHRCGLPPERACEFAKYLASLPGVRFRGIFTHEGHVYQPGSLEQRMARAEQAGKDMARLASHLRQRGLDVEIVSVGSSPARMAACGVQGVTENRPGTNILNDCTQVHLQSCTWSDCALSYECTVISRPAIDRAIIDGGSKTFSSDHLSDWADIGFLPQCPGARFSKASEEHGFLFLSEQQALSLRVGDRVRVIPNHACGSVNLHNRVFAVRDGNIVDEWKIEARGCVD